MFLAKEQTKDQNQITRHRHRRFSMTLFEGLQVHFCVRVHACLHLLHPFLHEGAHRILDEKIGLANGEVMVLGGCSVWHGRHVEAVLQGGCECHKLLLELGQGGRLIRGGMS